MNCREFRRKHDGYIDDTLSGVDLDGMEHHRRLCDACAQLDTRVRRALLVARNLPMIEVSAAFSERLQARLNEERAVLTPWRSLHGQPHMRRLAGLSTGTYAVMAAGMLAVAALAGIATWPAGSESVIRLAPVVASQPQPEPEPSSIVTPTMVAAVPAGMPLWPAVFVAQQASYHLASDEAGH